MRRAPNFNGIARAYAWMEKVTFRSYLARCRFAFLGELRKSRNALVIGDGDGRFTARLLEENPAVLVDALDASPAMLQALVDNAGIRASRVRVHVADARLWEPLVPALDLIVTHFFLDCLTTKEVASLAKRLRVAARADAKWVVSEFAIPEGWFGWLVARPLVTALYVAFTVLTGLWVFRLPNHRKALKAAGFQLSKRRTFLHGLLVSELWTVRPPVRDAQP